MSAVLEPVAAFWQHARQIAFCAADHGQWSLYERLKRLHDERLPEADWQQRERAMAELARIAGV